jgi:hypothetical protein
VHNVYPGTNKTALRSLLTQAFRDQGGILLRKTSGHADTRPRPPVSITSSSARARTRCVFDHPPCFSLSLSLFAGLKADPCCMLVLPSSHVAGLRDGVDRLLWRASKDRRMGSTRRGERPSKIASRSQWRGPSAFNAESATSFQVRCAGCSHHTSTTALTSRSWYAPRTNPTGYRYSGGVLTSINEC